MPEVEVTDLLLRDIWADLARSAEIVNRIAVASGLPAHPSLSPLPDGADGPHRLRLTHLAAGDLMFTLSRLAGKLGV